MTPLKQFFFMNANPNSASKPAFPSLVIILVAFALGIGLAGFWFHQQPPRSQADQLSASTQRLLGQLSVPVTIRYYAVLPAGSADETLQAFAGRVTHLLNAMQTASGGKLQLARFDAPAETNAAAAATAGLQPFNLDKGEPCYLGLAIASGKNTEAFARLSPEWEPALEFDLARAIERVTIAAAPAPPAPEVAKPSPEIMAAINRLIPEVKTVSAEQADQIFHAEFLKQCNAVGAETGVAFNAAQQQVVAAQNSGDAAALETAQKNLAQVQLAQAEKFKDLAAQLQTELAVFQRMKSGTTNDTK